MKAFLIALLVQSSLVLPPRTALEDPAGVSTVPQKLRKDYDKMWARFTSGKQDAKLFKDLDKLLKKQQAFDPALTIEAYIDLYKGDDAGARHRR